jgi:hypothetical protein
MSNITNIHKDFFHCHKYSKQVLCLWSYSTCFRPQWYHPCSDGNRQFPKRNLFWKFVTMEKVLVNIGSIIWKVQPRKHQRSLFGRISNLLHHLTFWKPISKRFDLTQANPPAHSQFYSRWSSSERFLPSNSVHNLCTSSQLQWHYNFFHGFVLSLFFGTRDYSLFTSDAL